MSFYEVLRERDDAEVERDFEKVKKELSKCERRLRHYRTLPSKRAALYVNKTRPASAVYEENAEVRRRAREELQRREEKWKQDAHDDIVGWRARELEECVMAFEAAPVVENASAFSSDKSQRKLESIERRRIVHLQKRRQLMFSRLQDRLIEIDRIREGDTRTIIAEQREAMTEAARVSGGRGLSGCNTNGDENTDRKTIEVRRFYSITEIPRPWTAPPRIKIRPGATLRQAVTDRMTKNGIFHIPKPPKNRPPSTMRMGSSSQSLLRVGSSLKFALKDSNNGGGGGGGGGESRPDSVASHNSGPNSGTGMNIMNNEEACQEVTNSTVNATTTSMPTTLSTLNSSSSSLFGAPSSMVNTASTSIPATTTAVSGTKVMTSPSTVTPQPPSRPPNSKQSKAANSGSAGNSSDQSTAVSAGTGVTGGESWGHSSVGMSSGPFSSSVPRLSLAVGELDGIREVDEGQIDESTWDDAMKRARVRQSLPSSRRAKSARAERTRPMTGKRTAKMPARDHPASASK